MYKMLIITMTSRGTASLIESFTIELDAETAKKKIEEAANQMDDCEIRVIKLF